MGVLDGKAVAITGSGRGIGAACARGAARQGAAVVVNDVDRREAEETAAAIVAEGGRAVACVADVTRWEEAGQLVETCISSFGKIDGLVNNAALFHRGRLDALDPQAARSLVEVNVLGPLHCAAHAVRPMLAQGSGSIVNVVSGAHMGMPTMGIYGATKGAAASMVYTWAMELDGSGVRVNGLSPFGLTRMGAFSEQELQDPEVAKRVAEMPPPESNSPVVEYLLSDLSVGVNGQLVRIDRGELQLYTHPALLVPPIVRSEWTAETVAEAFERDLGDRQIPCGVWGMQGPPLDLQSGYWKRVSGTQEAS